MIDPNKLGALITNHRSRFGLSLWDIAKETGVSASTLSRLERGVSPSPQIETVATICEWAGVPLASVTVEGFQDLVNQEKLPAYMPDKIDAVLALDKTLSPREYSALSAIFRSAYNAVVTEED